MEFPVEIAKGDFGAIAVENMETEEPGEVHYVYDNSGLIMAGAEDYSNITDLVLEDGTRAMIVNGTLVTADGQTLILQDGSDLSQFCIDDSTDEIVISKEQEDQFLQIMGPSESQDEERNIIQYVQDDSSQVALKSQNDQQIFYIQDGNNLLSIQEQYQIDDPDSQSSNEPTRVIKLENEQMLEEIEGVIDLDQLFPTEQGTVNLETGNYQYAVLKDGKFHLQTVNGSEEILEAQDTENQSNGFVLNQSEIFNSTDYLDLSSIKGRNVKTGQVITLSRHMDKNVNRKFKSFCTDKKDLKTKFEEENQSNGALFSNNLKRLINKKITIGQTDKGKKLVGKIVSVMKKADTNIKKIKDNNKAIPNDTEIHTVSSTNQKLYEVSNVPVREAINLNGNEESNSIQEESISMNPMRQINEEYSLTNENTHINSTNVKPLLPKLFSTNQVKVKNDELEIIEEHDINSKIIVHNKLVTKDCFEVITRTLTGLMNMDSVVKKLRNRTIIIKIIEKTYDHDKEDYIRSISYCSGYMVREYKLDDRDGSFSETWKFIPDSNSKETILGQNKLETLMHDSALGQNGLRRFANLTIQITIDSEGCRTTRVIINPPALFQCKGCAKSFRNSTLLKVHSVDCQAQPGSECAKTEPTIKVRHLSSLSKENKKGMYECVECNRWFQTSTQIRKHMDAHYTPLLCSLCKASVPNGKELNKHMLTHSSSSLNATSVVQQSTNNKHSTRKVFSCHICTRQFSRHSNLQRHIEIHQGEGAMYQCAVCSCSYHYISSLTRHVVSCHMDKSRKTQPNTQTQQEIDSHSQTMDEVRQDQELQFLQDDQIVQMIPLEHITESLQQYVNENMKYVTEGFEGTGDEVQILQIPVDSNIIIED